MIETMETEEAVEALWSRACGLVIVLDEDDNTLGAEMPAETADEAWTVLEDQGYAPISEVELDEDQTRFKLAA